MTIRQPDIRRPCWIRPTVEAIDFARLAALGRRILLLDVDNTLSAHRAPDLWPWAVPVLTAARQAGHIDKMCLVSNVVMGARARTRVEGFASLLQCPWVAAAFPRLKPTQWPYREALRLVDAPPEQCAFIGDQVFTDVVGANRLGLFTILVRPQSRDSIFTTLTTRRWREERLIRSWGGLGSED